MRAGPLGLSFPGRIEWWGRVWRLWAWSRSVIRIGLPEAEIQRQSCPFAKNLPCLKILRKSRLILNGLLLALAFALAFKSFQIGGDILRLGGMGPYLETQRQSARLERVLGLIETYYVDESAVEGEKLNEAALKSLVGQLDPYSEYMSLDRVHSLQEDTSQEFGGIGIQVEMKENYLTIVAPIEGTPGSRAGLLRGDRILEVDGESIEAVSLSRAVAILRGEPGSDVELTLFRPRSDERFSKRVVREKIGVESVKGVTMLNERIGYLRISQFGEKTGKETAAAIARLKEQGMEGLVLDLRNNPGGLLDSAVEVVEPFLEAGKLIVYTEGRHSNANDKLYSENRERPHEFPLAILVNSGSASAAEIVTGALKDHGVAQIVGERTFGKGSVQNVIPIGDGTGLKLTVARYYTPGAYVIHGNGIEPDIPIETTVEEDKRLAIQRYGLAVMSREEFMAEYAFEPIEDVQLSAAIDALRIKLNDSGGEGLWQ